MPEDPRCRPPANNARVPRDQDVVVQQVLVKCFTYSHSKERNWTEVISPVHQTCRFKISGYRAPLAQ